MAIELQHVALAPKQWGDATPGMQEHDAAPDHNGRSLVMGVIEIDGAIENGTKVGGFMEDGHMIYTTIEVLKKPKTDTVGTLVADANSLLANATGGRRRVRGWIDMGPSYRWPR